MIGNTEFMNNFEAFKFFGQFEVKYQIEKIVANLNIIF